MKSSLCFEKFFVSQWTVPREYYQSLRELKFSSSSLLHSTTWHSQKAKETSVVPARKLIVNTTWRTSMQFSTTTVHVPASRFTLQRKWRRGLVIQCNTTVMVGIGTATIIALTSVQVSTSSSTGFLLAVGTSIKWAHATIMVALSRRSCSGRQRRLKMFHSEIFHKSKLKNRVV